jgi:hypothetical protein
VVAWLVVVEVVTGAVLVLVVLATAVVEVVCFGVDVATVEV